MTALFGAPIHIGGGDGTGVPGPQGPQGPMGYSLLAGNGAPNASLGNVGDVYVDLQSAVLWAPKTATGWPTETRSLVGANGLDGAALLNGYGAPNDALGQDGDSYFNSQNGSITGPKAGGTWPTSSVSLLGPKGADGSVGTLILAANGSPTNDQGRDGDFFVDTDQARFFGPKTGGDWGDGFSLIGPRGTTGDVGPQGASGLNGADGASLLIGSAPPTTEGKAGDVFIDSVNAVIYGPRTPGGWPTSGSSFSGPTGPVGPQGPGGAPGVDGAMLRSGTSDPSASDGNDGDFYFNSASGYLIGPKANGAWPTPGYLLKGPPGTAGADSTVPGPIGPQGPGILSGSGKPSIDLGTTGSFYINGTDFTIYGPKAADWGYATSIIGPQGTPGANSTVPGPQGNTGPRGPGLLAGNVPPATTDGNDGDVYIDTSLGKLYPAKSNGGWSSNPISLLGPAGPQGAASTVPGPVGPAGASLLQGSGPPSDTVGTDGDLYFDSADARLYSAKSNGRWSPTGYVSLIGPQGIQGVQGNPGANGVDGANGSILRYGNGPAGSAFGNDGDFYIDQQGATLTGPMASGAWPSTSVSLVGPTGAQGSTILTGSGAPTPDVGRLGDCYYDSLNGYFYGGKTASGWPTQYVALVGIQGAAGFSVLSGNGLPDPGLGRVGDLYVDILNAKLYPAKTASGWTGTPTDITGPAGPQGPVGSAGPPGPTLDVLTSQSAGCGPSFCSTAALSSTPVLGVYPGTTQGVAFSPTFATSFMGATYTNINSAVTLTLYDQTAGAVVWSGVATGGFTGNIGQFTLGQYPMPAGHSFVWQLTSTTAATASIWMAPIYAFPAASPTYNVSCMGTVGVINASMTGAPTMKVGNTAIAYSSKFSKASQVYSVTINNQSNFVVTCKLIYNGGTSPVLFSAAAPANAVTTFGPYALGAYVMNAGYQYYWTATGSGTGSVFLDMFVAFSIA